MATKFEAKFLEIDIDAVRAKLKTAGATLDMSMRLMRREMFDFPDGRIQGKDRSARLRIRDEGDKITITYKKAVAGSDYDHEIETTVGAYESMKQLLETLGLSTYSYQESRREAWELGEVEIVIDEWPWLKPYIEIEGPSEESIQAVASKLGFKWTDAKYGSVDTAYMAQYPKMSNEDSIGDVAEVKFDAPLPEYLKERM